MSYAEKFLKSKGQDCIIERTIPVNSKVSIKRSTKASRDLGIREGYWEGLILYDAGLKSGDILSIRDIKYLVQTVDYDPASMECAFFSAKCNSILKHQRYVEDLDEYNNIIQEWQNVNPNKVNIPSYGEIITYRLRQVDPGLLDSTKYTFQVPKSLGVILLDRFVFNGDPYQVDSIDDVGMAGVARVQVSQDTRP